MWKYILIIALLLSVSVALGWIIQQDPGYVLLSYHNWTLETSLWFGLASLLVLALVIQWAYKLLKHTFILPTHFANWSSKRKQQSSALETSYGFCELLENHWDKAEQKLSKAARHSSHPFANYLGAAFIAQQKSDFTLRDDYLQKALASLRGSDLAVTLFKIRLQMNAGQNVLATHNLETLLTKYPKHSAVLKLALQLYSELNEWPTLLNWLPSISKHANLSEEELKLLNLKVYTGLLKQAVLKEDPELLEQAWLAIPGNWKNQPELLSIYAGAHLNSMPDSLAKLLEDRLKKSWNEDLVQLYGLAVTNNPAKQLKLAESWLKQYPRNVNLLVCLARLSLRDQLWGKAQDYFNASLSIEPRASTYWELAKIQEQLKRMDAAYESYKRGLALAAKE